MDIRDILQRSKEKPQDRAITFKVDKNKINDEQRTVELSFSSQTPVKTWFGWEILDHNPSAVRLDRLNDGAPVLWNHDPADQRGVVEKAWIDAARGRAVVRFGKSAAAEELFQDVKDGIKRNISILFDRNKLVLEKEEEGEDPVYRTVEWEPYSIDFVWAGKDATVGVGRSREVKDTQEDKQKENRTMDKCQICGKELVNGVCPDNCAARAKEMMQSRAPEPPKIDVRDVQEKARRAEADRTSAIFKMGEQYECMDLARKAVEEGISKEDFKGRILETKYKATPVNTTADKEEGIDEKDAKQFSISRAINAVVEGNWEKGSREKEMSDHVAKLVGRKPHSFYIPYAVMLARRDVFDTGAGAGAIATNLLTGSFIEMLRAKTMVLQMGATVMPGLVGDVAIPKQTASVVTQWKAESTAAAQSRPEITQLGMTPKTITGYCDISRKLLIQSSMAIEPFVQNDLMGAVRRGIDYAAINGAGSSTEPLGILMVDGTGAVTSSGTLSWANIVDLWTKVADEDADFGALGYLTRAYVIGKLATTEKATNTAQFICPSLPDANGMTTIAGQRCGVTSQIPKTINSDKTALIYGNWASLVIGMWRGLDVLVDPYSRGKEGDVRVVVHQDVDTLVRHAQSFSVCKDIDVS